MKYPVLTMKREDASPSRMMPVRSALILGAVGLAGCVSVKAPDKPIEINLNISIKQEVVVSLKKDAEDLIANNPELFPK